MKVIHTHLYTILERFPDHKEAVRVLFNKSEAFRSVCKDYGQCLNALEHWNRSTSGDAPARRQEYAALLEELEAEILQSLMEART